MSIFDDIFVRDEEYVPIFQGIVGVPLYICVWLLARSVLGISDISPYMLGVLTSSAAICFISIVIFTIWQGLGKYYMSRPKREHHWGWWIAAEGACYVIFSGFLIPLNLIYFFGFRARDTWDDFQEDRKQKETPDTPKVSL